LAASTPVPPSLDAAALLAALGGEGNVQAIDANSSRVCIHVFDSSRVDDAALSALGARGVARPKSDNVHVVVGPGAATLAETISRACGQIRA
jgi:PTS system N-acetylglucosamine-specific IIC component